MIYLLIFLTGIAAALQVDNFKAKSRILKTKAWSTLAVSIVATVISFLYKQKQKKILGLDSWHTKQFFEG